MGSNPAIPTKVISVLFAPGALLVALGLFIHGAMQQPPPLILVTNDDGVHAPGIKALAGALAALGEVHVVAPDREVSACAQSLTLKHPLRAEKIQEQVYSVDGTPADCVNLALVKLLPRRPDLVVSGINRGASKKK